MITITLAEKNAVCEKYPNAFIVRTMKQDSKRHHYYMAECGAPMRFLRALRGEAAPAGVRKGTKPDKTTSLS